MRATLLFLTLSMLALAIGCSPVNVKHDYDSEANFAALKTYGWMTAPSNSNGNAQSALQHNSLLDKRIKQSTDRQLAAKGYTKNENPDFLVAYHVGAQNKINVTDWGYGYGPYGRRFGGNVDVRQYKEGTLVLDIIDARTKELVWRGIGSATIDPNTSAEKRTQKLDKAISQILAKFPPMAG